jgi:mono/diheme cytochrome c family protein
MKLKVITGIGLIVIALVACNTDAELEFKRYYSSGSLIYQSRCQNCHGKNGEGLQALIPPLTDTAYLKANKKNLACIVKYGMKGTISLANKFYQGEMPPNDISPVEVAEVLTYVTNSFGNKMGTVTSEHVVEDLKGCR